MNINKEIFPNALVKGDQVKVLDMQLQIYIINLFPGKLLSVDSFQKLHFCITGKKSDFLTLTWITSCNI